MIGRRGHLLLSGQGHLIRNPKVDARTDEAHEQMDECRERVRLPTTCGYHEIVVDCHGAGYTKDGVKYEEPKCFGCPNRATSSPFLKREDW